jgi:hypothetical protein
MDTKLLLSLLRTDGGTQPRCQLDLAIVDDYAAALRAGAHFPPVEVFFDSTDYWVADGFHRIEAARQAGLDAIDALVHEGTRRDAILFSAGANAQHGLRRTNPDKRHVVVKLLQDPEWSQWSDREIGRRCGVDDKTVAKYRAELSAEIPQMRTVTRQGTRYEMNISNRKPKLPATAPDFLRDWVDLGEIGNNDAIHLNDALADVPPEVVEVVKCWKVTDPHSIPTIVRMYHNGTGPDSTFAEVRRSGMIQPGDEGEAVPITAGQHALEQAMARKHQLHRQLAAEAKAARLQEEPQSHPEAVHNILLLNLPIPDSAMGVDFPGLPAPLREVPPGLAADAALFLVISSPVLADGMALAHGWEFKYHGYSALLRPPPRRIGESQEVACEELLLQFTRGQFQPASRLPSVIRLPSNADTDQVSQKLSAVIKPAFSGCRLLVIPALEGPVGQKKG